MRKGTYIDLTGNRYSRLVVIKYLRTEDRKVFWLCLCDCGNETQAITERLRNNSTRSCGCLQKDRVREVNKYKGLSQTKVGRLWYAMKSRCYDDKHPSFKNYGGRGIKVCDRWLNNLQSFVEDMGHPKNGESLDRIDVNGDYSPDNCKWSTKIEQCINTRIKSTNTSGHKGVSFSKSNNKWVSYINIDQKRNILGYFVDIQDAINARKEAETKYWSP